MKKFTLILYLSIIFVNLNIYAQYDESKKDSISYYLPKVVVTANRYEKNIFETNIPVNMAYEQDVWQRGIDNIGDLFQQSAGVTFLSVGPWSQKLVIRGLAGPQVLMLVDGLRLDVLRSYGYHAPLMDVDQIERIEIMRGPASILYGSEAIGGVINLITKKTDIIKPASNYQGNIGFQYSSVNQQYDENLTFVKTLHNWSFLINFNNRHANDINTPQGRLANTGFNGYSVDARINYILSHKHQIRLTGQSNRFTNVGVPINEYAQRAKFLKYYRDMINLFYEYLAPQSRFTNCQANIYYQQDERNFDAFIYHSPKGLNFVNQTLNAHRHVNSYGGNIQSSIQLFAKNLLTAGIDLFANFDDTRRTADPEIYNNQGILIINPPVDKTPPTPKSNRNGVGIFVEDEYAPWAKWSFTVGMRFDYIISKAEATPGTLVDQNREEFDGDISYNLGTMYRLTNNIHIIGNIGRAFKAPTLQERYFKGVAQVGYLYGNPELKSETSLNIDAGIKWQFNSITGEFNLFRNRIDNLIVMKPISAKADTFLYDNVGLAELYGGEIQAKAKFSQHISVFMNASYVHGQDIMVDGALPQIPPLEAIVGLRCEGTKGNYWLEFSGRFVDSQHRVVKNEMKTPGYQLFDITSGINLETLFRMKYSLFLMFNIKNMFNEIYRDHLSSVTWWDAPGRNIIVGLRTTF